MDTLLADLRFAVRSLRKQRGTTVIAVLCLALGIGANTAIFSVVRAVLIASLPYRDAGRLVRLYETGIFNGQRAAGSVSVPGFLDVRAQNTVFDGFSAFSSSSLDLVGAGPPERVRSVRSRADLFDVLGARPLLGRTFAPGEDQAGRSNVVIVSEGLWRRRFGADPRLVGQSMSLDNTKFTVIGVMPSSFDFPISPNRTDVWVPLVFEPRRLTQRGSHWLATIGRLKPGIDSAAAAAQLDQIGARFARDFPEQQKDRGLQINSMNGVVVGRIRPALLILLGAVSLVLLIACANVANLLLARASDRRREVAIRIALGAERSRLIRQFLTESVLLAVAGGGLGVLLARWGLTAILALAAGSLPRADEVGIAPLVLLFATAVSVITGLAFGIVPALRASQTELREDLTESVGRTSTSRKQHRTLDTLIVTEIALSLVLLVGAGLLIRGFKAVIDTDPGLKPERVLTFHVSAPGGTVDSVRWTSFYGPVLERLRALPGVRSAGMTQVLPIQNWGWNGNFTIVGRPKAADAAREPFAEYRVVSADYFKTLGIPMVSGREFTDHDVASAEPVVVVNDAFVKRYMEHEDPLTKQILPWTDKPARIIGVAHSVRQTGLDQEARPELYVAAAQTPGMLFDLTYIVSTQQAPEALVASVREAVQQVAPQQPIYLVSSMDKVISDSLRTRKLMLTLLAVFAGLAVALSAAGVYGVMSYGVAQRTREIGIRMALGARGTDVTTMVLTGAAKVASIGVAIGVLAALGLTQVMQSQLYGVGARDPLTFVAVALLITLVALVASAVPAFRAARVDPLRAMRMD